MFNSSRLRISVDRARNERQRVFYQLEQIRGTILGHPSIKAGNRWVSPPDAAIPTPT